MGTWDVDLRAHPIVLVDDEPDILRAFTLCYGDEFTILTAADGATGLALLEQHDPAVIVADQRMPHMSGTEFLERTLSLRPDALRVVLTGYTDIDAIIRAVNESGIYHYATKPWVADELRVTLRRAVETFHLRRANLRLVDELRQANQRLGHEVAYLRRSEPSAEIIGDSAGIRHVRTLIEKLAPSSAVVLIDGETGTGKELVARAVHAASPRHDRLFVPVNCAALADGVLDSELFGHRRGSFTGAIADRKGLFELADGGTLFLDEIVETSVATQAKLLRALQNGEIRPVGESRAKGVDVRVIAASNRPLARAVEEGHFRQDLYYRLAALPIRIPPLRERREDIPLLAVRLSERIARRLGRAPQEITSEALAMLARYDFPGNVRELENEIERAILLSEPRAPIEVDVLSEHVRSAGGTRGANGRLQSEVDEFERSRIRDALAAAGDVKARAAETLGLTYRGLLKKMQRLGMLAAGKAVP